MLEFFLLIFDIYSVRDQIKNQDSGNSIITEYSRYTAYMFVIHITFHKKSLFESIFYCLFMPTITKIISN